MGNAAGKHRPGGSKYVHWDNAVTPAPPGKPQLVPGTPHTQPDLVTIRWEPPVNDGGAPVTGYLVEHRRTGSPHWVRSTPSLVPVPELTLSGLEPGWRYQFRVSAQNVVGLSEPGDVSEPLTVTLNRSAAAAPHFIEELHDTIALENETAEFKVHFRGTPTPKISWYKDGFEIFSSRRMRVVTEGDESSLVFFQTAFSDEGEIKCTATNRVGHIVSKAKLRLEAPPSIRIPRQYEDGLLFEMGEIIRLKVSVAGRPLPRVTWFHNGEQVMFGGRYEVVNTDRSSSLRVGEARRADRGEYQVRATNRLGEDLISFLVTVTDRPVPPGKARVVTTLGRSVTLSWTMPEDDGGCKIGNYIVEYYRIGWNVWLKAATCRQLTTTLGDLIEGSEYKFRVKAENPYGVSDPSEESDAIFIPDPKRGLLEPPVQKKGSKSDVQDDDKKQQQGSAAPQPKEEKEKPVPRNKDVSEPKKAEPQRKGTPDIRLIRSKEWETIDRPVPVIMYENSKAPEIVKRKNKENVQKKAVVNIPKDKSEGRKSKDEDQPPPVPPKTARKLKEMQEMAVPKSRPAITRKAEEERKRSSFGNKEMKPADDSRFLSPNSPLTPREEDDSILHGSSELMLVLLPESGEAPREDRAQSERPSEYENTFQESESLIAPPMSLSAPELGSSEPAINNPLRNAVSSTELLHEKAMARFYQAVAAEEAEKARQRRQSIERSVPGPGRTRLTSLEDEAEVRRAIKGRAKISTLEEEEDTRRMLKGATHMKPLDKQESLQKHKSVPASELKPISILSNKGEVRGEEEEDFARIRERLHSDVRAKQRLDIARMDSQEETEENDEDDFDNDSLDASLEYDDDDDEPYHPRSFTPKREARPKLQPSFVSIERGGYSDEEEEDTYHPRSMIPKTSMISKATPSIPSPTSTVPKTILKQSQPNNVTENIVPDVHRSLFPAGTQGTTLESPKSNIITRSSKSPSPAAESDVVVRRRKKETLPDEQPNVNKTGKEEAELHADDVGLSAAEIARKRRMQARQSSLEEEAALQRVVTSHYGDLIREYGRARKQPVYLYTNTEELKAAADTSTEVGQAKEPPKLVVTEDVTESMPTTYQQYEERWKKLQEKQLLENQQKQKFEEDEYLQQDNTKRSKGNLEKAEHKVEKEQEEDNEDEEEEDDEEEGESEEEEEEEEEHVPKKTWWWGWWQRRNPENEDQGIQKPPPCPVVDPEIPRPPIQALRPIPPPLKQPLDHETQMKVAEKNVRSFMEYISDLAIFSVACWLYIFENELLAIPLLVLMIYRQVYEAIKKKITAKWRRSR